MITTLWYFTATLIRTTTDLIAFLGIWRISHNACNLYLVLNTKETSFEIKMMVKIYAIEIISKSHEPFQSYQGKDF